nr:regulatory protein RecX [Olsenella uli]
MEDLVGRRDYSSRELTERLLRDGYARSVVEEIVARAVEVGIVDDARYGAAFARSKALAGWGRVKIERELSRRGVEPTEVPGWPEEFLSADDERERALALASRRRLTGKNDYQKLVRFLCGRGFAIPLATSVAREVLEGVGE